MKVYLFKNDFSRSEVERFTKKQCEQYSMDVKPISWFENYINSDAIGLDLYIRIA